MELGRALEDFGVGGFGRRGMALSILGLNPGYHLLFYLKALHLGIMRATVME